MLGLTELESPIYRVGMILEETLKGHITAHPSFFFLTMGPTLLLIEIRVRSLHSSHLQKEFVLKF